mmetsp:Transcript_345/g.816  ORF Transcript_345/g.816 Transcript_345/m.816 type:complete len:108 (-) Transcript_345:170-493(-)
MELQDTSNELSILEKVSSHTSLTPSRYARQSKSVQHLKMNHRRRDTGQKSSLRPIGSSEISSTLLLRAIGSSEENPTSGTDVILRPVNRILYRFQSLELFTSTCGEH